MKIDSKNRAPSLPPRVAVIHEWFTAIAGSEKVVEQILGIFPNADIFVVYANPATVSETPFLANRKITTSFISNLPMAAKLYRTYLPLMPLAVEQFDLSGYDIVISSSHAVAKGVLTGPDQLHISYVHSPIRYAWDLQHQYLRESGLNTGLRGWITKWLLHKIRVWDYRTAAGVDEFVANSKFISRRINKVYGRSSVVIYPPVDVTAFEFRERKEEFYLAASRAVPYKRLDIIVEAFASLPNKKLVVIGDGPDLAKLRARATPNVSLLGYQPFDVLRDYMQRARAFVFAAEEDFGIMPIEAQACGTPVIAYGKGGSLETVIGDEVSLHPTGTWFRIQSAAALKEAIEAFEARALPIRAMDCRLHSEKFSTENFVSKFKEFVDERWSVFVSNR